MGNNGTERRYPFGENGFFYSQRGREGRCGCARETRMWIGERRRSRVLHPSERPPTTPKLSGIHVPTIQITLSKQESKCIYRRSRNIFRLSACTARGGKQKVPLRARPPNKFWRLVHPKRADAKLWLWLWRKCDFQSSGSSN